MKRYLFIPVIRQMVMMIKLAINLFESISLGSSLNPDDLNDDVKFDNQLGDYAEDISDEDNDLMEEDDECINYDFKNTVEKIFKTEKIYKNLIDNDPKRFEDVDI